MTIFPPSDTLGMSAAFAAEQFGFPCWLKRPLSVNRGLLHTAADGSAWEFDGKDWIRTWPPYLPRMATSRGMSPEHVGSTALLDHTVPGASTAGSGVTPTTAVSAADTRRADADMRYKNWETFAANMEWQFFWMCELLDLDLRRFHA